MCKSLVSAGAKSSRGSGGNPPLWDTAAACPSTGKQVFFPFSLTTPSGPNAQLQAETACCCQLGCLPGGCDARPINVTIRGKDIEECLRASPCTGAGSLILNDRRFIKPILKSLLGALLEHFLPLSRCCDFAGPAAVLAWEEKEKKKKEELLYSISVLHLSKL